LIDYFLVLYFKITFSLKQTNTQTLKHTYKTSKNMSGSGPMLTDQKPEWEMRPLKIDLHTHILPKNWPDLKKKYGYGGWISMEHLSNNKSVKI